MGSPPQNKLGVSDPRAVSARRGEAREASPSEGGRAGLPLKVGLLLRRGKPEAIELAAELAPYLRELGHEAFVVVTGSDVDERRTLIDVGGARLLDEREVRGSIDLLVALGGDGTILRGGSLVADEGVPILGINLGTLGFLSCAAPVDAREVLGRALDGTLPIEERMRLRCELRLVSGEVIIRHAANDAVVAQGALARLIELDVSVDDVPLTRYRADGLIVATPTGSTAYNLAAGGPIVAPAVQAVVLSPICPHTLTNRPIVLPSTGRICVSLANHAAHVQLTLDGQWGQRLREGDCVVVSQAALPLYLYRAARGHFEVLREKLGWGGTPFPSSPR